MSTVDIGKKLLTQDNLATSEPVFVVYDKERVLGVDPTWTNRFVWIDNDGDVTTSGNGKRVGFVEVNRFRAAFFTRDAADAFVVRQRHNMRDPFVYVESGHHNPEWKELRAFLIAVGQAS